MKSPVRLFRSLGALLSSALSWVILLCAGGGASVSMGVAMQFGAGFGLVVAGLIAMAYGIAVLRGLRNAE